VRLAVATALGVQPQPKRELTDTIVDALQTRELLLVLDNCEHVLEGVALLVSRLLSSCPQLSVLATSREALRVPGEHLFEVPPMAVPTTEGAADRLSNADAVRLFVARAQAVRPGFALSECNAGSVVNICWRLDGMPLAIELAAARSRVLTPGEIAARLDDRFRLLTGRGRAVPERQQTLYNTVAWSYELLEERERVLFDRLSIFSGGFTLEAAEGVCGGEGIACDDVLEQLVSSGCSGISEYGKNRDVCRPAGARAGALPAKPRYRARNREPTAHRACFGPYSAIGGAIQSVGYAARAAAGDAAQLALLRV
jgi:predicted ATPase